MKPPVLESGTSVKMWGMAGTGIIRLSGTVERPTEEGTAMAYYHGTLVRTNGGPREALGGYSNDRFTEIAEEYILKQAAISKPWFLWLCYPGVHGPYTPRRSTYEGLLWST